MLQNRVTPAGDIVKTEARGHWMGNRGVIHNRHKQIIRSFGLHAWITCRLSFKNRKLPVMEGNHNTQLFFFDEVTAFAAGHRPCAYCRREDYNRFKSFWLQGNPGAGFTAATSIKLIDDYIHAERITKTGSKITYTARLSGLPNGAFVLLDDLPFLVHDSKLYLWSPYEYEKWSHKKGLHKFPYSPRNRLSIHLKRVTFRR